MTQPLPAFLFWLCGGSGVLMVVVAIPLWLRRVPPNRIYGARFSATLSDPYVWYEINALAGRELALIGAVYALLIAGIALRPGWNNAAALLIVTGLWVVALLIVTVHLASAANRLRAAQSHDQSR